MNLVIGIDPGSRVTGYGLVADHGGVLEYVASGCIRVDVRMSAADRLVTIFNGLLEIIESNAPHQAAIEELFVARNPSSSLKLGQARGVALLAARLKGLDVHEYAARQIKQSVVGTGAATKEQIKHMVKLLLDLKSDPQQDAADALAIAVCHINTSRGLGRVLAALDQGPKGRASRRYSRGRYRFGSGE